MVLNRDVGLYNQLAEVRMAGVWKIRRCGVPAARCLEEAMDLILIIIVLLLLFGGGFGYSRYGYRGGIGIGGILVIILILYLLLGRGGV
jgi:hypothetical protein